MVSLLVRFCHLLFLVIVVVFHISTDFSWHFAIFVSILFYDCICLCLSLNRLFTRDRTIRPHHCHAIVLVVAVASPVSALLALVGNLLFFFISISLSASFAIEQQFESDFSDSFIPSVFLCTWDFCCCCCCTEFVPICLRVHTHTHARTICLSPSILSLHGIAIAAYYFVFKQHGSWWKQFEFCAVAVFASQWLLFYSLTISEWIFATTSRNRQKNSAPSKCAGNVISIHPYYIHITILQHIWIWRICMHFVWIEKSRSGCLFFYPRTFRAVPFRIAFAPPVLPSLPLHAKHELIVLFANVTHLYALASHYGKQ